MFLRSISDIHLEFSKGEFDIPKLPTDKDTVLVLAGDIGIAMNEWTYVPFIEKMSERFLHIIYINGNHEHYKGKFLTSYSKIADRLSLITNADIMEKETMVINNVAFVCATLWTDMSKQNPHVIWEAQQSMNDYKTIRHGPTSEPWKWKLRPHDTVMDHIKAKSFIFEEIKKHKTDGKKVVVVTHHAPHAKSLEGSDDAFRYASLNGAYYTELFEDIMDTQPDLWCHGHLHQSSDYKIGKTRILCNPRGYFPDGLNPDFNPELLIEV